MCFINRRKITFTVLHLPMFYYYDVLHGLRVLTKLGYEDDERLRNSVHLVMSKRRPDGRWLLEGDWFNEPGASNRRLETKPAENSSGSRDPWGNPMTGWTRFDAEEVGKPSKWVTLNSYRGLTNTGDIRVSPQAFPNRNGNDLSETSRHSIILSMWRLGTFIALFQRADAFSRQSVAWRTENGNLPKEFKTFTIRVSVQDYLARSSKT